MYLILVILILIYYSYSFQELCLEINALDLNVSFNRSFCDTVYCLEVTL